MADTFLQWTFDQCSHKESSNTAPHRADGFSYTLHAKFYITAQATIDRKEEDQ